MGKRRVWTEKDKIDLVFLLKDNKSWKAIAAHYQCNVWQVQNFAYSMNLTKVRFMPGEQALTLRIDPVLLSKLEKRAHSEGLSKSEMTRRILSEALSS